MSNSNLNRREFLEASAAGAGAIIAGQLPNSVVTAAEDSNWPPKMAPIKIHKVYLAGSPSWPKPAI